MAATAGKKSKKAKWVKANITDIFTESTAVTSTTNWAEQDEETESFHYQNRPRQPVVLPSASRAARGGMAVDDESIPQKPPFIAYISNLPYDVDESAILDLFVGLKISNLRLPREGDRLKGFGYVDFEDRDSLVGAMNIADLTISNRRIRIEVSTHDNDRRMGRSGGRNDREREYDPERTMGDWRSGPRTVPDAPQARPRTNDRERERERDSSVDNKPGGWRDGDRPAAEPPRPYGGRDSFGRDRYGEDRPRERGYGGRDGFRPAPEREGFGNRESRGGYGSRGFGDRDRERDPPKDDVPRERPKLNLLPRTVPRETEVPTKLADGAVIEEKPADKPAPKPVSAESVFGAAKPVDTAAREREIEEKLKKQEEEARKGSEDKERWPRKENSDDRRGPSRRDDRGRDSRDTRSYRDRQDYSRDDKDRRDYSKDNRDRRDYSHENRDRRDHSGDRRDDRSKRDSRDDRDARDYSRDSRDNREDRRESPKDKRDSPVEKRADSQNRNDDREKNRDYSGNRNNEENPKEEKNGSRLSRSRDRNDKDEDKPLPKLKEQEKPNFVGSNAFSCLEDTVDSVPE